MIKNFLWWYGWKLEAVVAFCLDPNDPIRTPERILQGVTVVLAPVIVAGMLGIWYGKYWNQRKPAKRNNILDDSLEKVYKLRVVYMFPPNKERYSSKYVYEATGKEARFAYSHYQPFKRHNVDWFIVSDHISGCKGNDGNIELRVVEVQPVPKEENLRRLEEWTGKVTYK